MHVLLILVLLMVGFRFIARIVGSIVVWLIIAAVGLALVGAVIH